METKIFLNQFEKFLQNSEISKTEQLLQKIIDLAAKQIYEKRSVCSSKLFFVEELKKKKQKALKKRLQKRINRDRNKLRRRIISKRGLKCYALRKIQRKNKKLHSEINQNHYQQKIKSSKPAFYQTGEIIYNQFHHEEKKFQEDQQLIRAHQSLQENQIKNSNSQQSQVFPLNNFPVRNISIITKNKCHPLFFQNKFKKTRKNFYDYLKSQSKQAKTDQISCPICIDILIDPVSTLCGHSFCFKCLDQSLLFGSNCPVCRLPIKGLQIITCQYLNNLIKVKCNQFVDDKQVYENFKHRRQQRDQWKKSRVIDTNKIYIGQILDVRDTQNIWCKAKIIKIYQINNKISSVLIHYLQWAKLYDQIIQVKSIRLAPKDHFSSRTDIPRYNLNSDQQNIRGAVISGSNEHRRRQNNQLFLPNIIQLDSLRNSLNSIRNNMQILGNQLQQASNVQNSNDLNNHQVGFLHRFINRRQNIGNNRPTERMPIFQRSQLQFPEMSDYDAQQESSSLGSFVFQPILDDSNHVSNEVNQNEENLQQDERNQGRYEENEAFNEEESLISFPHRPGNEVDQDDDNQSSQQQFSSLSINNNSYEHVNYFPNESLNQQIPANYQENQRNQEGGEISSYRNYDLSPFSQPNLPNQGDEQHSEHSISNQSISNSQSEF